MTLARPGSRFLSFVSPYYQEEGKEEEEALIREKERERNNASAAVGASFPFFPAPADGGANGVISL